MHTLPDLNTPEIFRADLHCHSTFSDGSLTPKELIDLAVQNGLSGLSITDHDNIGAYAEAIVYAKEKKIILGTGVEFSCEYKRQSVHILGYGFSVEDQDVISYCIRQQKRRTERNKEILRLLAKHNMPLQEEELLALPVHHCSLGRLHIAWLMLEKGYVKSLQEAFLRYLGDDKCCFARGDPFSVEEASEIIHKAGGKVFLAHPHLYHNDNLALELLRFPLDGIECYYGISPLEKQKRWLKLARKKGLLVSGGSDFHGKAKPHISLGCSWVDQEIFFSIFKTGLL